MTNSVSLFLNISRAIAAFFVVVDHLNSFTQKSSLFIFHQGHNAVIIFFIVSGYLIGGGAPPLS